MRSARDSWLPTACAIGVVVLFAALGYAWWRESQPTAVLEHPLICQGERCWVQETWVLQ